MSIQKKALRMTTNKTDAKILHPELSFAIVGACFDVHNELGRFAREKQYADALEERFRADGLRYVREFRLGDSRNVVDFLVEEKIILELKTVRFLTTSYFRQIQNYLQQARVDLGLLINFSDIALQPRRILRISDSHSQSFVDSPGSHSDPFVDSDGPIRI
ncbi:hypothetical protein A2763_01750 [Candidatus Kaiserbacteria bacterium RIFCSPHIGHO2_01_FULL_54_36]|uniref:GxxExxY protein n=1 Tax=Candidatus Kaiserbacteria bacterium RIFCSPHIGHO2_01_FULL_54_36 TaxID=1798482 RepID=A0A1F6CMZ7_9BACT|nr:MAG: hypothetical protein A2763_01750 [Candidatus Kaiserbacteria bacterium RIFCSPHIGHO2_01_FULL_54_36]OGG75843.1 MAG: hypothetical protein A3A41_02785 [Candidatus Kaiserbacteria bacterium RIFCSPLOWO2_01_FULL_54_22]